MKQRTILWAAIGLLIAAVLIFAAFFFLTQMPTVESHFIPGSTPVHIFLSVPQSPAGWPLNAYIPVQAQASGGSAIARVELYVNGQLYGEIPPPAGWSQPEFTTAWHWQPGQAGTFILAARAVDAEGGTGISDPVRLEITAAAGTVSPYLASEGETLQGIAESSGASLEELVKENPSIASPELPLPGDIAINIPNPPAPVTNDRIISALPPLEPVGEPASEQESSDVPEDQQKAPDVAVEQQDQLDLPVIEEEPAPDTPQKNIFQKIHVPSLQDLQYWIGGTAQEEKASLPYEPKLDAQFSGCKVTLRLANSPVFNDSFDPAVDTSHNESGFFVYRSQDGEPFERLATLPEVKNFLIWEYDDGYILDKEYGQVGYTISAFNPAGETTSAPVVLPLDQLGCEASGRPGIKQGKIKLDKGDLILPYSMDVAYLYLSIDNNRAQRIPEGDRMFLPDSGVRLNLYDYFNTLLSSFTATDFDISMEVWGWSGGKLKFVGTYKTSIHRSVLLVCSEEGQGKCSGNGDGEWVTEVNFSSQKPVKDQVYEFKWISSQISKTRDVCYEFSAGGFPDDNFWNMYEPISAGCMIYNIKGSEGTFTMYMSSLLYPTEPPDFTGWGAGSQVMDYNSNWFQNTYKEGSNFTIYARALPRLEMTGMTQFSNLVTLHKDTSPVPSNLPPLASPNPSLYEVEILRDTYIPPTFETEENWGCVVIDEDPSNPGNVGKTVCPPKITAKDDCAGMSEVECLLKGTGNAILFVVDHFVYAIKMIKWEMTEAVTYTIPYCHDYGPCYKAVEEVVEQIVYYGIGYPPHTDTSEDLIAGWIGSSMLSTASEYTSQIGVDEETLKTLCGDDCQEKIGLQVIQMIRQKQSMQSQQACINAYQAYFHGREAMCLDPSIIVHPAEGSGYYPAGITIKITRKVLPTGQNPPPSTIDSYKINVAVSGSNDNTAYGPGFTTQLYAPVTLPVYILNPGESMVLNTKLIPCPTYGSGSCVGADGWKGMKGMYYDGTTHMEAAELCFSPGSSVEWVPCTDGGFDSWEFENPKTGAAVQP